MADGRRVSAQCWNLFARISDLDNHLDPLQQSRVREVHPELSFLAWAESTGENVQHRKKSTEGCRVRQGLIRYHFGEDAFDRIRGKHRKEEVADDDISDAFAALWTAERINTGRARILSGPPFHDSRGLKMEIVY
jgi:predicted RNase H-like nuclease